MFVQASFAVAFVVAAQQQCCDPDSFQTDVAFRCVDFLGKDMRRRWGESMIKPIKFKIASTNKPSQVSVNGVA
jgi:hypothetical protein